jgi:hypothetical protein
LAVIEAVVIVWAYPLEDKEPAPMLEPDVGEGRQWQVRRKPLANKVFCLLTQALFTPNSLNKYGETTNKKIREQKAKTERT